MSDTASFKITFTDDSKWILETEHTSVFLSVCDNVEITLEAIQVVMEDIMDIREDKEKEVDDSES